VAAAAASMRGTAETARLAVREVRQPPRTGSAVSALREDPRGRDLEHRGLPGLRPASHSASAVPRDHNGPWCKSAARRGCRPGGCGFSPTSPSLAHGGRGHTARRRVDRGRQADRRRRPRPRRARRPRAAAGVAAVRPARRATFGRHRRLGDHPGACCRYTGVCVRPTLRHDQLAATRWGRGFRLGLRCGSIQAGGMNSGSPLWIRTSHSE
jgi:hypothetical protein